jgi:predicted nuclease with TOPRIM domain
VSEICVEARVKRAEYNGGALATVKIPSEGWRKFMDVQHMSKEQLIDLASESGRNLENYKRQITSLEADQRKLVALLLRLTKITSSLRNRLFELSLDNKALTESLEKRAPDVHALFSDLRSNSKNHPSLTDFPSVQELEESIEAILGPIG